MTNREYRLMVGPSLEENLNNLVQESGLDKSEILRQAVKLYLHAYKTVNSGGKCLLQDGKTYENREVKLER